MLSDIALDDMIWTTIGGSRMLYSTVQPAVQNYIFMQLSAATPTLYTKNAASLVVLENTT
jgi:hypothetical protein